MEYVGNYQRFASHFRHFDDPCMDHPQNQNSTICIANHKCKRKFCSICQFEHQVELNQMIPYHLFTLKLQGKISELKLEDNKILEDSKIAFKNIIGQMEKQFQLIVEDFRHTIKHVYEVIEKTNKQYLDLITNEFDPRTCSNTDLNKLIQIYVGTALEDWIKVREDSLQNINSINQLIDKQLLVQLGQKINEQMKEACKIMLTLEETLEKREKNVNSTLIWEGKKIKERAIEYIPNACFFNVHEYRNVSIEIEFSKQNQLNYIKDGEILRIEKLLDTQKKPQFMKNIEQIKYLRWEGQYDKSKIGIWVATWNDKELDVGGYYDQNGLKEGVWKELFENYWENANVIYIGEYKEGNKQGNWDTMKKVDDIYHKIGGGQYNINGKKNGKWIDIYQFYYKFCQIYFSGNYQDGIPIGQWEIIHKDKKIGGGEYDQQGNKIGKWKELEKNFWDYCQVTKEGSYQSKKKRCGRWDNIFKGKIIAGGSYDENSMKDGEWTELYEHFWDNCQVTYVGQYKNGTKKGRWNTMFENKIIAGGNYDDFGMKYGQWSVIHKAFQSKYTLIQNGKYQNGKKAGKWSILHQIKTIGGGNYDENEKKIGKWIELHTNYGENCMVIYTGEYKEGIKVGTWETLNKNILIGGGFYNDNGLKDGKWIELLDSFDDKVQSKRKIYHQEYQNGIRIGASKEQVLEQ